MSGSISRCRICWSFLLIVALCAVLLPACERGPSESRSTQRTDNDQQRVEPPAVKPEYTFAEEVREQHVQIVAFLRQFLETCLAGDYAGYRKLASRKREAEGRERFQAVFHAIRTLRVESIEPIDLPRVSEETYLVTCAVDFLPESKTRLRRNTNKIAILVLKEEGEWRVLPAPTELQPPEDELATTTSAPATTMPSYPWDEDGDF